MAKDLDEFFKTFYGTKPSENFVEDPAKIEKATKLFEEERARNEANPAGTKITKLDGKTQVDSGVIDVSGLVDEPKVIQPTPVEEKPIEEKPLRERLGFEPIKREIAVEQPQQDSSFPIDRLLVGATPLLVGLLTGNKLEGVKTSADYFTNTESDLMKRQLDLNAKLATMKSKLMNGGGSKRYVAQTIALNDGSNVKAAFDTFSGKYHMPDGSEIPTNLIRAGYAVNPEEFDRRKDISSEHKRSDADYLGQGTRTNPVDGELTIVRNGRAIPIQGIPAGQLNKNQEKDMKDAVKEFTGSAPYKDAISSLQLAPQVTSLLDAAGRSNDPNSIAGSNVVLTMIRQAQRVGVASDRDAAAMGGTQQFMETAKRIENKLLGSGTPLTQRDVADLREISNIYTKSAKRLLSQYYGEKRQSFSDRMRVSPEIVDQHLGSEVRPYLQNADRPVRADNAPVRFKHNGEVVEAPNRTQRIVVEIDGKKFASEEKLWDQVKKKYPNAKKVRLEK